MRVLLTANASYDPPRGGSTRSNLAWLRHLAASGHACSVVCPTPPGEPSRTRVSDGITIHGVRDLSFHAAELGRHIEAFRPDWILVSSEDVSHVLLREAGAVAPGRVVYLAHTPQFFPFGPESWHNDRAAAEVIVRAAAVVTIGHHMASYARRHLGRETTVIHPPIYGCPPYRQYGRFGSGTVLMINPCAVKGLPIFLALADRFSGVPFAALTGWGTTSRDRAALASRPNVRLLESVPDIEEVLAEASLLLMPSLWYEGFGLIAMEAMLRGLPVIASDSGGLLEAKHGTRYVIPVNPITGYERSFDETLMPRPIVPPQNLEPWADALTTLLRDEDEYRAEAARSRAAALAFISSLDAARFEQLLCTLPPATAPLRPHGTAAAPDEKLRHLDAAKRALLLARLKHRKEPS